MKGVAHHSLSVAFPDSKSAHLLLGWQSFPVSGWPSPGLNSRPSGGFLHHHNWVAITTVPQHLQFIAYCINPNKWTSHLWCTCFSKVQYRHSGCHLFIHSSQFKSKTSIKVRSNITMKLIEIGLVVLEEKSFRQMLPSYKLFRSPWFRGDKIQKTSGLMSL